MIDSKNALLFVAHPGHELLIHGWLSRVKPLVCVLTDGSGHSGQSRLHYTEELLRATGAPAGGIFGRFTDRGIYAAIRGRDFSPIAALADELAADLIRRRIEVVVADAMEGYNPAHDLCRLIVGAACARAAAAGVNVRHYEYPIFGGPNAFDDSGEITTLDDVEFAAKIERSRAFAAVLADVDEMLTRFGDAAFRREAFRAIGGWSATPWDDGSQPMYEIIGEERVAA